ncbi:MAG TPA: transcriptional regulator [Bryobacteraceae bacterium]|nr:transcriptional regulator [Bryobacteraceae bacterium]
MPANETGTLPEIDPVVHGPLRLAVLSLLIGVDSADFKWLRDKTGSTDGNLGANLARLEEARYIAVTKKFIGRKPTSLYRLTPAGRKALAAYVAALRRLLGEAL